MKIRSGIQIFWIISYFGILLSGIIFSGYITRYMFPMLTISILVPFVAVYYLSLTNKADPGDFNNLNAMFLIYAFVAVFYADDPYRFFTSCVAIFIVTGFQSFRPNWLFEIKSRLQKKKE